MVGRGDKQVMIRSSLVLLGRGRCVILDFTSSTYGIALLVSVLLFFINTLINKHTMHLYICYF